MEVTVNYKLEKDGVDQEFEGEAKAVLEEKHLRLIIPFKEPEIFSYSDIIEINEHDYKINLTTASKERIILEKLGYQYEDFLFQLFKLRNELLLKYLLMEEPLLKDGFYGKYFRNEPNQTGNCEIRLYENALVILPQKDDPIRLPYCYISEIDKVDYKLSVRNEFGEVIVFSMLGEKFDPLIKALSEAYDKMILRTHENIKALIPGADTAALNKLTNLMKDGKAASKKSIEQIIPEFWQYLTKRITATGLEMEYNFLNSLAQKNQVFVGLKRGLMGELTGSCIWMMFPLIIPGTNKLSNTIALEAFSTQENTDNSEDQTKNTIQEKGDEEQQEINQDKAAVTTGATYFFKIIGKKEYTKTNNEKIAEDLENFVKSINRCMIDINFRREPISIPKKQLGNSKYNQYRYAIERIQSLKTLRNLFIGRVIHSSPTQWKNDVTDLLTFNNKSLDDNEKWKKGEK